MSGEISKTFQNWANSPLANYADTLVGLPGVGPAGRDKFIAEGITNVLQIMGMFLLENQDEERMREWLIETIGLRPVDVDGRSAESPGVLEAMKAKATQIIGVRTC
eukprot:TRINITY_DN5838_c0_g1_i1.p2 TRINITY_DN5838_c0_g1~~TRINITY_DN5838_c0_g1_i1.p2  ORF type:complete len:106 (-),score=25.14 TRINITY_DN5838_c0_g1_i1:37-354(-)